MPLWLVTPLVLYGLKKAVDAMSGDTGSSNSSSSRASRLSSSKRRRTLTRTKIIKESLSLFRSHEVEVLRADLASSSIIVCSFPDEGNIALDYGKINQKISHLIQLRSALNPTSSEHNSSALYQLNLPPVPALSKAICKEADKIWGELCGIKDDGNYSADEDDFIAKLTRKRLVGFFHNIINGS